MCFIFSHTVVGSNCRQHLHVHLKLRRAEWELDIAETVIALWGLVEEEIEA